MNEMDERKESSKKDCPLPSSTTKRSKNNIMMVKELLKREDDL